MRSRMSKPGISLPYGVGAGVPLSRSARVGPAGLAGGHCGRGGCLADHELPWCGRDDTPGRDEKLGSRTVPGPSFFARSTAGATRSVLRARAQRGGLWIVGGVR